MSVNAVDGQAMIDACKQAGVKLLVGYRMHFEPKTLEIIRMRKAGSSGRSVSSRDYVDSPSAIPRNGG